MFDNNDGRDSASATIKITGVNDDPTVSGPVSALASEDDVPFGVDLLADASDLAKSGVRKLSPLFCFLLYGRSSVG